MGTKLQQALQVGSIRKPQGDPAPRRRPVAEDPPEEGTDASSSGSDAEEPEADQEGLLVDQMSEVPFEVLERLRRDGRGPSGQVARAAAKAAKDTAFGKRENKHRPQELSSKKPVGRFREVVQLPKKPAGRDPRFDETCGTLDKDRFRKRYEFLYKEQLPEERRELKAALKRERDEGRREELQGQLNRVQNYLQEGSRAEKRAKVVQELKVKEKAAVKEGKKPFFMKRSDVRKAELIARYKELKASGQLKKFLEKRRKRNASKDHKLLPGTRREEV